MNNADLSNRLKQAGERWSVAQAQAWYNQQKWIVGFNYIPSTAVNFVAMWHPATFDVTTIERELNWAAEIGYNSTRINLQYNLWQDDRIGFVSRVSRYLEISHKLGLSTVICLFDDCGFSGIEPNIDIQPAPKPGIHNSRALASPGRDAVMDTGNWPAFKVYVQDIITKFKVDERVLFWDLYNEPGNGAIFSENPHEPPYDAALQHNSLELCVQCFKWARAIVPTQPITSGAWKLSEASAGSGKQLQAYQNPIDEFLLATSDIVTFHAYCDLQFFTEIVEQIDMDGRPILCTEWMARAASSYLTEQLPVMKHKNIGAFQWGFVRGRSQTHLPWPAEKAKINNFDENDFEWFHDVIYDDGTAYRDDEILMVKKLTSPNT
ncbi:MAG: cellulase family glycosylhydrolase [Rhizobiales bacterium]|nr:cellulase family glycosylhydrolase [Hyphomicrobiales bacterium]NRB13659.1 cellulase family glycosylhydrolase [Hyphomicrobiales bacterium]